MPVPEVAAGDEIEPCPDDADTPGNSPATGAPAIGGTAQVGETLTADTSGIADADGLTNATFAYQWLADDTTIQGATSFTYTLADTDAGKTVKVRVSFTDDAGNSETLTSAATGAVSAAQPAEPPAKPTGLSATALHDSVTLTWNDPGDDSITGYVILRRVRVNNVGGEFSELVPDTGTAATIYTDGTVAAGTTYTYRIKAINGAGTSERSRWFHVDTPSAPAPEPPLTARIEAAPDDHNGTDAFTFRVAFSENIGISYRSLREDAFTVTGGRVTGGRRVDGRRDLFEVTVEPDGDGDVTITLPAGRACTVSGAICTKGENRRRLTNTPTATVLGPATPRHLTGTAGADTLAGRDGNDVLTGGLGADALSGGGGHDTLVGDDGDATVSSADEGNDLLYGGSGDDLLYGDGGNDALYGDDGESDPLAGNDLLYGGRGDDLLFGDGGDDALYGNEGNDTLDGGAGTDTLTGGTGADTFVFAAGHGADTITDFTPGEGDRIDLSAFADLGGFASLTLTADGSDTVLDLSAHGGGTVRLQGIAAADLLAADFLWP